MSFAHLTSSLLALSCCLSFAFAQDAESRPTKRPALEKVRGHEQASRQQHIQKAWDEFQERHPKAAEKMKAEADTDGDGKLSKEEREAARDQFRAFEKKRWEEFQQKHPEASKRLGDRADRDDDGKVDAAERLDAMRKADALHEKRVENFDKDGNGRLDAEEREAERRWLHEHNPRPDAETEGKRGGEPRERADVNNDGKVGPRERERMREVKERADVNNDGRVGPRERRPEVPQRPQPRK